MSQIAIQVEGLSKRYRIGLADRSQNGRTNPFGFVTAPFRYLASTLREPKPEEIIWALNGVSFEVRRGEVLGIVGRNGAGKSTLLKILSRITEPTGGRALIHGRVGSLLEVGTGFHPELTGRENVYLNGAILGMRKAEIGRKFDEIVAFSGVERFIDTPVKRYSSGMYVRLAFAVAAHLVTEILLVDEVLAVGDAAFQKKCLGKMGSVAREGRTVLFVSHNMLAIRSLCDDAILIAGGRASEKGSVNEIVDQYLVSSNPKVIGQNWEAPGEAPGDQNVRVKTVMLEPVSGAAEPITVNTPIDVRIELWSLMSGPLNLSLHFKTLTGETVFATVSPVVELEPGVARFVCRIPGGLLNDGHYSITLFVVREAQRLFILEDTTVFEIHDIARGSGSWLGKWPGVVRPTLAWRYQSLPEPWPLMS